MTEELTTVAIDVMKRIIPSGAPLSISVLPNTFSHVRYLLIFIKRNTRTSLITLNTCEPFRLLLAINRSTKNGMTANKSTAFIGDFKNFTLSGQNIRRRMYSNVKAVTLTASTAANPAACSAVRKLGSVSRTNDKVDAKIKDIIATLMHVASAELDGCSSAIQTWC